MITGLHDHGPLSSGSGNRKSGFSAVCVSMSSPSQLPSCSHWPQLSPGVISYGLLTFAAPYPPAWKTFFFCQTWFYLTETRCCVTSLSGEPDFSGSRSSSLPPLTRCSSLQPLAWIHFPYLHAYLHNVLFQQTEPASLCSTFFFPF